MKKLFFLSALVAASLSLGSCMSTTTGGYMRGDGILNSTKQAHGSAGLILGCIGANRDKNSVQTVAAKGGIKKVSHVEYSTKSFFGGVYIINTTTVYGE